MLIFEIRAVLMAELLTELYGTCGAGFNALAARYAVLLCNLGGIGAARKIRCVKQKRCAKSVAYLDIAVAYVKYLIFTVNVGYLVNIAVLFGELEYFKRTFFCYIMSSSGFNGVIRHVAELYAPIVKIVCAAVAQNSA